MPRKQKATAARLKNLNSGNSHSTFETFDSHFRNSEQSYVDAEHDSSESDSESEFDLDSEDEEEVQDEAALLFFVATMQQAHDTAFAEQQKRLGHGKKRPRHYTGKSVRNTRRFCQKRREYAEKGGKFIDQWFPKVEATRDVTEEPDQSQKEAVNVSESEPELVSLITLYCMQCS